MRCGSVGDRRRSSSLGEHGRYDDVVGRWWTDTLFDGLDSSKRNLADSDVWTARVVADSSVV